MREGIDMLEQRAKKLTEIANEKAEKLLKARDRH
jgi:hypothetical protein